MAMGEAAVASFINGVFNLAGTGLQAGLDYRTTQKQNEYNMEMWNLQNEYNSPKEQMRRLEEAGLNPNLMYGQGTTGNAQSAPQKHATQYDVKDVFNAFNVLNMFKAEEELEGMKLDNILRQTRNDALSQDVYIKQQKDLLAEAQNIADQYIGTFYNYNPNTGMLERNGLSDANWSPIGPGYYDDKGQLMPARTWKDQRWYGLVKTMIHNYNTRSFFNLAQKNVLTKQGQLQGNELYRQGILYQPWRLKTGWWNNQVGQGVNSIYKGTQIFNPTNYMVPQHFHNNFNYNY